MSDQEAEPGTDETLSPVATPEDELAFVQGRDQERHPDDGGVFDEPELSAPDTDEETVSDEELARIVADVDVSDVDHVGHDENDLVIESNTEATVPEELRGLLDPDDVLPV